MHMRQPSWELLKGGDEMIRYSVQPEALNMFVRIMTALVLSAAIGYERSSKRHSAGLRTFIAVALASASAAILEDSLVLSGQPSQWIVPAVIISVALISCPQISFSSKGKVKGLTTSVGLWACCIIGIASGKGLLPLAVITAAVLLCTLTVLSSFEAFFRDRSNHFEVQLELKGSRDLQDFTTTIRRLGMRIDEIELNPAYHDSGLSVYTVSFTVNSQEMRRYSRHSEIIGALRTLDYIAYIEEIC